MKKLFEAIRHGDAAAVTALLDKKPELIACTAKAPQKKDAGQSPLQVAIKSGNFAIAQLLLDRGADVNFMEAADCGSPWRMPVVHDAIMAAVKSSRFTVHGPQGYTAYHTQAQADEAYAVLERIVTLGADLTRADSYGNTALDRALLDTRQIIPGFHHGEQRYLDDRTITPELDADLMRIFALLIGREPGLQWDRKTFRPQETLLLQYLKRNGCPGCEDPA